MNSRNKVRRRVLILAFLVSLVSFNPILFNGNSFAAETGDFTIALSNPSPAPGSTITASLSVFAGSNSLAAYDITLKFAPAVLQVPKVQGGTTEGFSSITNSQIDNNKGEVKLVHFTTTYGSGVVNLALITFDVIGAAGSSTIFTLTVTDLMDPGAEQIAEGTRGLVGPATVTVVDTTPVEISISGQNTDILTGKSQDFMATAIYSNQTSEDVTQSASWLSSVPSVGTISAGIFQALAPGQTFISASLQGITSNSLDITVGYCGDVNSDNLTNMIDAMFVAQYGLAVRYANELRLAFADVDLNGDVDVVDAMKIAQFAVDLIQPLCVE